MDIFIDLYSSFLIVLIPISYQRTTYQSIDERKFKKYKLKKFGFLFKGMQGQSASTHGVIIPMLVIQVQGYILGIASFSLMILNSAIHFLENEVLTAVVIITLFVHVLMVIIISTITGFVSKKRKKIYN